MSNYQTSGTFTADGNGTSVSLRGWATLTAHFDSGSGTVTWQFKGPDGVWRSIYGGSTGTTEQAFTVSHMINVFFGGDVAVRAVLSASSSPQIDYQIISNPNNRP